MRISQRLKWLRTVLLAKAILSVFVWGLPALLGSPAALGAWFNLPIPEDPLYLRLLGAVILALGAGYGLAYLDPMQNLTIIRVGIVDNALVALVIIFLGISGGISSWFLWATAVLTALFSAAFALLMPRGKVPSSSRRRRARS